MASIRVGAVISRKGIICSNICMNIRCWNCDIEYSSISSWLSDIAVNLTDCWIFALVLKDEDRS